MHVFPFKTNIENFIALTEQVKYLSQCVKKLMQRNQPYGIPSLSRIGSQDEPIILSDDEIVIKSEKIDVTTSMDKKLSALNEKPAAKLTVLKKKSSAKKKPSVLRKMLAAKKKPTATKPQE